jgi:hypothetical protein
LLCIAQSMEQKTGIKNEEEFIDMKNDVLMVQNLMGSEDLELARLMKTCWRRWKQSKRMPASMDQKQAA